MTYPILPIGVTSLVIYLFSLYLSSAGFTGRLSHRRFWNWLLLGSFLVTALFGLFMALKITYRWDIPFSGPILHWHVETGIAMAIAAVIHLTWHIGYYFSRAVRRRKAEAAGQGLHEVEAPDWPGVPAPVRPGITASDHPEVPASVMHTLPLLLLTGFVSSSSQFILMREAIILGGGTEVSAGLFLWLWLIIAAAGAMTGSMSRITDLRRMIWTLLSGTALAPLLFVLMNTIVLSPGATPSLFQILVILSVSVAPVTFISSLIFVRLSGLRQADGLSQPGGSFATETAGSVAAGIVTVLTVTLHIPNYELYLLILLLSAVIAMCYLSYPVWLRITVLTALIPLGALVMMLQPDLPVRGMLLRGVKVQESIDTPYGNITSGTYGGERTVYYDHRPLFFSGDVITEEENIHYALLQRKGYDKVMLISGGLQRHLEELMKHDIRELVYLEPDPGIIAAGRARDTVCGSMKVTVISSDPITFMNDDGETWDAVLQLIPPPSTLSVNRYYTVEYFRLVREHLSADGIFMCTPMPGFNYTPESFRKGFSPLYNALAAAFTHIAIIPGSSLYAVASGQPLTSSVVRLADGSGIQNSYVNSDYLDDNEIKAKREQVLSRVDREAGINSALRPLSALFANILSLEKMGMRGGLVTLLVLLILVPLIFAGRGGLLMFASSAGLSGFGMIMIFILQMAVGNIYLLTAVILTLLMAGLAAGGAWGHAVALKRLTVCVLLLSGIYTLTGLLAPSLVTSSPGPVLAVMFVTLPAAGFVTGAVYRIVTAPGTRHSTGAVYASDLAGSALGYMTVSTLLVPLAGTDKACFVLAALILVSGIVASVTIKH
jgi:spermidine synthase